MSLGAGIPLYVVDKDPKTNNIIMGPDEMLFKKELTVENPNFISPEIPLGLINVTAKTRYNQKDIPAVINYDGDANIVKVFFDNPQRAITPGQTAVFYVGENVLGGGVIIG